MKTLLLLTILPIFFIYAYADPHFIEPADNNLATPGCLETEIGCYTPNILTVGVGHTITMTNTDMSAHTFTSGTVNVFIPSPDGIFNSGILMSNDLFEWIPDTVGEYPYYDMLHVWMQGIIIVEVDESHPVPEQVPEFPMILDRLAMRALDNNLMRLSNDIARADADIDEMMYYLEGAIERDEWGKIQRYSERIGSLMAFIEICYTLVDIIEERIQLHS